MIVVGFIAAIVVAALVGFFIGRNAGGDGQRMKLEYEQRLQQAEQELQHYQQQVSEHFKGTAALVEQMNENYRAVYQHLASGAQHLAKGDAANAFQGTNLLEGETARGVLGNDGFDEREESDGLAARSEALQKEMAESETQGNKGRDQADSARQAGL